MARAKHIEPVHPLRMAEAITEINARAGAVIIAASTAADLASTCNEAQLRKLIEAVALAAEELKAALWPQEG